jgi:hypothetical protein
MASKHGRKLARGKPEVSLGRLLAACRRRDPQFPTDDQNLEADTAEAVSRFTPNECANIFANACYGSN